MQARSVTTLLSAATMAVMACGGSAGSSVEDPRPTSVEPGSGSVGSPTLVVIHGDGFLARATQQASGGATAVDVRHRAWLGDAELEDVAWIDVHTLSATVPAGLPAGPKALEVENPFGRRGRLEAAFVVDASPTNLTAALGTPGSAAVGTDFDVTMTVTNSGGAAATAVAPTALTLTGSATATLKSGPAPASAAVAGGGGTATFTWVFTAGSSPGTLQLTGGASGKDANTGATVTAPSVASGTLTVGAAALSAKIEASPPTVNVGETITLRLTLTDPGTAAVTGITPGTPSMDVSGGAAATLTAGPTPTSIASLAPSQSGTFTWTYNPTAAGRISFTAQASGTDSFSHSQVSAIPTAPAQVTVQRSSTLTALLDAPSAAGLGTDFSVTMEVTNSGDASATAVAPGALTLTATGGATAALKSGPTPASADVPGGGGSKIFTWTYTAGNSAGSVQFSGGASGKDANTGATVTAASVNSGTVTLGAAALSAKIEASPLTVSSGQTITVRLRLTNSGSARVTSISPGTPTVTKTGGAGASLSSGPSPASISSLDPGHEGSFTWTYSPSATAAGQLSFTASATGTDSASNAAVTGTPLAPVTVTVQRPAALGAALSAPASAMRGADFQVGMQVTNSGDAGATAVAPTALKLAVTGSASAKLKSGPSPATANVAGGTIATFTWTYTAGTGAGTVQFSGGASGKDANTNATVTAPSVSSGTVTLN